MATRHDLEEQSHSLEVTKAGQLGVVSDGTWK